MNHFPPLSLSGANAISVRTLALTFWLQEIMGETIHGNWNPHLKVRYYFVRNTPPFWLLSDCYLIDNHTYFHEKNIFFVLFHSVVPLVCVFYTARWQCIFKCSIWEIVCHVPESFGRTLRWMSQLKWVEGNLCHIWLQACAYLVYKNNSNSHV